MGEERSNRGAEERSTDELGELTRALYRAISGPAGAPRDWEAHRALFLAGAAILVAHRDADDAVALERLTVEQYRASREPYFARHDFFELEIAHQAAVSASTAIVLSRYASYRALGEAPIESGVNTLQLVRSRGRWRIASILWEAGPAATALRAH